MPPLTQTRRVVSARGQRIRWPMPSARLLAALAAALVAAALFAPAASARNVKLRAGSFSVKAPAGFKLQAKKGIYRVTGRGLRLVYARVPANGRTPADTGAELARAAGGTATRVRSTAKRWTRVHAARRSRCGPRARS